MNEKQKLIMDELFSCSDAKYHDMFLELAEYCISLGYNLPQ